MLFLEHAHYEESNQNECCRQDFIRDNNFPVSNDFWYIIVVANDNVFTSKYPIIFCFLDDYDPWKSI